MDDEGVSGAGGAEDVGWEESGLAGGDPVVRALAGAGHGEEALLLDLASDVFVADEVADVLGGGAVAQSAGEDQLRARRPDGPDSSVRVEIR